MFPSPCGADFAEAVRNGADPKMVVPDDFFIVHGGSGAAIPPGITFSGATGRTLDEASAAVPHGTIRFTTVREIREMGGTVEWLPEISRHQTVNQQHVNVTEKDSTSFSDLLRNPVPREQRIDGQRN